MNRGKKAVYNSLASAISQIVSMICGFILPRLILSAFGSSYNGITSSVAQFLSVIALLRAGVGGATRVSLYKSLADNNIPQVSATVKATEQFMRKVALLFSGIVVLFSLIYPYLVKEEFDWLFASSLVLVMSLSTFVQYFFGITYQFLFQADQRQYITSILEIIAVIVNTLLAVILIHLGVGIHGVKLGSAVAFSITPIALRVIAKKRYRLDPHAQPDFSSISQRWDAFFHQLAAFIHNNTDITLLTIFTNTREISVYTVYYLVANGLKHLMNTLVVGVESAFGNIIAKNETDTLRKDIIHYETLLHVFSSILFGAAIVLVTPFVQVYTNGITDVNYSRYMFGYLVIIGEMLYVLRSPYEALVNAAGHFKQTKKYAFFEAGINLTISILLVRKYGITGVVIGTVIAIIFRNIAYGVYISKAILHRGLYMLFRRFCVTASTTLLIFYISHLIPKPEMVSYSNWIIYAIQITILTTIITFLINILFYRQDVLQLMKKMKSIIITIIKR